MPTIEALFFKPAHGRNNVALAALTCIGGLGIEGDVHANRLSPRQVLVTLDAELRALGIAPGALHENIVISLAEPQQFAPGALLRTAGGVAIRLTMYCEPCQRIVPVVGSLRGMIHRRGILGTIEQGGAIRAGDAVELVPGHFAPLPEAASARFADFVSTIPAGRVVRYLDVTIGMGVAPSSVRAIPGFIKRAAGQGLPLHRIVNARGELPGTVPGQAALLAAEGVGFVAPGAVSLAACLWRGIY